MKFAPQHWGLGPNYEVDELQEKKGFVIGIELEIESIISNDNLVLKNLYNVYIDKDHSLRNNGYEYKFPPMDMETCIEAFKDTHKKLKLGKDPFSDRTSIHVHVNCRDLSAIQLRELVLKYALVEPLFFNFVGDVRKNSIFCVPLNYTYLPDVYKKEIANMVKEWHKYTAFNIVPLGQFGTMEFRHLFGTADVTVFTTWLKAIRDLFNIVRENPEQSILSDLAAGATAAELAKQICPTFAAEYSSNHLNVLLQNNLLDVKLASGGFYK